MAERRKKILLNPNFQIKFVGFFITFFVFYFLVTVGVIHFSFKRFEEMALSQKLEPDNALFKFLGNQESQILLVLLIASIVVIAISIIGGLYLSHRVAGPIAKICEQLQENRKNKIQKDLRIRKDDFFQELPIQINLSLSKQELGKKRKAG